MERASGNPLIRGSLTIGAGIVVGNLIGFARVAVTAYLLGTRARADALAVAIGPIDTLNSVLINTMLFAFVPMLMLREGPERVELFRRASSVFTVIFASLTAMMIASAPLLIHILGPGLAQDQVPAAVNILRITAFSTLAAGGIAIQAALLFTERRFGPSALYQASLNLFTIAGAFALWRAIGIYGFAIGYTVGAFAHFVFVWLSARESATRPGLANFVTPWRELFAKPGSFCIYAVLLSLNVIVTRAHATHAGPGMAAAFDYCIRCVNVVVAYLVSPISNSLLPEISRLKAQNRTREAWGLIDRTTALVAAAAIAACVAGVLLREPVIAILFQRGNFTADSTRLVSGVFLGFAPGLIGWTLFELTSRSLFALNRPWLPMCAAALPVLFNILVSSVLRARHMTDPEYIGLGASLGLLLAFSVLFGVAHLHRRAQGESTNPHPEQQLVSHS
ncbi:MAG: virulence factor family protein [Bryobacterales bacterium]|nr:virulence factor family protein [Bryobacterales bacterium]